jgi:hypothetical protein
LTAPKTKTFKEDGPKSEASPSPPQSTVVIGSVFLTYVLADVLSNRKGSKGVPGWMRGAEY